MTPERLQQIRNAAALAPIQHTKSLKRFVLYRDVQVFGEVAIFDRRELLEHIDDLGNQLAELRRTIHTDLEKIK